MKVTCTIDGTSANIGVAGDLDSNTAPMLQSEFDRVLESGAQRILVDVSEVTFLSSSGLSVLIDAQQRAQQFGVNRGNRIVDRLLVLVGLTNLYGDDLPAEPDEPDEPDDPDVAGRDQQSSPTSA
jgi:anti-sigma B factor antagonist